MRSLVLSPNPRESSLYPFSPVRAPSLAAHYMRFLRPSSNTGAYLAYEFFFSFLVIALISSGGAFNVLEEWAWRPVRIIARLGTILMVFPNQTFLYKVLGTWTPPFSWMPRRVPPSQSKSRPPFWLIPPVIYWS